MLIEALGKTRDAEGVPGLEETALDAGVGSKRMHCSNNSARVEMYQLLIVIKAFQFF